MWRISFINTLMRKSFDAGESRPVGKLGEVWLCIYGIALNLLFVGEESE